MIRNYNPRTKILRKEALYIISRYLKTTPKGMKEEILRDMINMNLLKRLSRDRVEIINHNKSDPLNIDSGILVKIIESGERKQ